jgi:hypothetical protein
MLAVPICHLLPIPIFSIPYFKLKIFVIRCVVSKVIHGSLLLMHNNFEIV